MTVTKNIVSQAAIPERLSGLQFVYSYSDEIVFKTENEIGEVHGFYLEDGLQRVWDLEFGDEIIYCSFWYGDYSEEAYQGVTAEIEKNGESYIDSDVKGTDGTNYFQVPKTYIRMTSITFKT